jgi:DNA-binding transcriptional MerR regulator
VLDSAPKEEYSRQDVRRMLGVSEQQLRSWERHGLIHEVSTFSFSDLIALKALQKLRENRIPPRKIGRALTALKKVPSSPSGRSRVEDLLRRADDACRSPARRWKP